MSASGPGRDLRVPSQAYIADVMAKYGASAQSVGGDRTWFRVVSEHTGAEWSVVNVTADQRISLDVYTNSFGVSSPLCGSTHHAQASRGGVLIAVTCHILPVLPPFFPGCARTERDA